MMARHRTPPTEVRVTDGTRGIGLITPKGDGFTASLDNGRRVPFCSTMKEARAALFAADLDQRELDRLADDGGRPD